mgnify:CR=1 FL=1
MPSICTVALYLAAGILSAGSNRNLEIPTLDETPVVDGVLDETAYSKSADLDNFSIYRPTSDASPRFQVNGHILATQEALYIGLKVETGGAPLYAPRRRRDSSQKSDKIQIELSPFESARRAYLFELSAGETLRDGIKNEMGDVDDSWDSLFDGRIHQTATGFSAEIKIPFQSLRFDSSRNAWGMHIFVHSRHYQQSLSWVELDTNLNNWLRQMGKVAGLQGRTPGRSFELLPSLTAGRTKQSPTQAELSCEDLEFNLGSIETCNAALNYSVGLKWGITPSLTLDSVFNPDFSQIESDAAQLTLNNRFALSYPERRPFFMEGNDIFDTPLKVVYTRSINQPTGAIKLTGKVGNTRVGFLTALDPSPSDSVLDEGFSVSSLDNPTEAQAHTSIGRLQWDLSTKASVGGFIINKSFHQNGSSIGNNFVGGFDGQAFATDNLSLQSAIFGSQSRNFKGEQLNGVAHRTRAVWKNNSFRLQSHYQHVSSQYRSEAGFIPRTGYHNAFIKADGYYFSDNDWGRKISPGIYAKYYWDENGDMIERTLGGNTWWLFGSHIYIFSVYERRAERYEGRLEKHQDQWLDGNFVEVSVGSSTLHWLTVEASASFGDTILRGDVSELTEKPQGWFEDLQFEASVRPTNWLELASEIKRRTIQTSFGATKLDEQPIFGVRSQLFFSRDIYIRYLGQWQPNSSERTNDLLFSYVPSPGTVLFLGFQDRRSGNIDTPTKSQTVFLKLSTNLVF